MLEGLFSETSSKADNQMSTLLSMELDLPRVIILFIISNRTFKVTVATRRRLSVILLESHENKNLITFWLEEIKRLSWLVKLSSEKILFTAMAFIANRTSSYVWMYGVETIISFDVPYFAFLVIWRRGMKLNFCLWSWGIITINVLE